MTELTLLTDAYYFEPIGQGESIRHNGKRGEFHNVDPSEAKRLLDAGLAVPGRINADLLPADPTVDDGVITVATEVTVGSEPVTGTDATITAPLDTSAD